MEGNSSSSSVPACPRSRVVCYALLAISTLAVDLISKEVAFRHFGGPFRAGGWILDGWLKFEFHTSLNQGALWGMGQGGAPYFAVLSIVAFLGINYWLFVRGAAQSLWLTVSMGLISGGTIGNLYDRLAWHGECLPGQSVPVRAVRDFLHFQLGPLDWAIFNFADVFLVVGSCMLVLQSLFFPGQESARPAASPAA